MEWKDLATAETTEERKVTDDLAAKKVRNGYSYIASNSYIDLYIAVANN